MDLATRKLDLIAQLALVEDEGVIDSVARALGLPGDRGVEVDPDEVLGTRPDGTPVTIRNSVDDWNKGVEEVLAGGGVPAEEVLAKFEARARRAQ